MDLQGVLDFYRGRRVLVTGHTGFKGSWLTKILMMAGAEVTGYSLAPHTNPSLFALLGVENEIRSEEGDVRDFEHLAKVFAEVKPEVVLHLAAQPIVREAYRFPRYTYETNVMGTVNVCECVRLQSSVESFLNVTTDKVYENKEWCWGYRENESLDGFDPYSNSKSCSELVTHAYANSFFQEKSLPVSTARAGNVIGGGDFSQDRIIPDCVRAALKGEPLIIRNPASTRPYQHVLEPLFAYLMLAARQHGEHGLAGWYNVGPNETDCVTTGRLAELFQTAWGEGFSYEVRQEANAPHEANFLKLDTSLIKQKLGWRPVWNIEEAVARTVEWTKAWLGGENFMERQIRRYLKNAVNYLVFQSFGLKS